MQKQAYDIIDEYTKKHKLKHDKNAVFVHLIEEVGEIARNIYNEKSNWRKEEFDREKLSEEVIDTLMQLIYLARDYNIDLESTFIKKIKKLRERFELE